MTVGTLSCKYSRRMLLTCVRVVILFLIRVATPTVLPVMKIVAEVLSIIFYHCTWNSYFASCCLIDYTGFLAIFSEENKNDENVDLICFLLRHMWCYHIDLIYIKTCTLSTLGKCITTYNT